MEDMTSATHAMLIYNTDKQKFMYNAGDENTQIWTFVGDIPAVGNITDFTTGIIGDIRYCKNAEELFFWNGSEWRQIQSAGL